jgi:putative ABC transport system permease protein
MRGSMLMLSGAVVFILLMACASVINLLLARLLARQNEFAVRMALGAGRSRLLSQHLMESLMIAPISMGLALLVGMGVFQAVAILSSGTIERLGEVPLNGQMLMFVVIVALLTTIFIGSVPAFQFSKMNVSALLRHDKRSGLANVDTQRLRSVLVVSEVALALVLLCGAGLMLKNFLRLQQVDPGFDAKNLVTVKIAVPEALYPKLAQRTELIGRLLEKTRSLPGIQTAAVVSTLPLSGESNWETIRIVGQEAADWAHEPSVEERSVSADYFRAMRIPYLQGHGFRDGNPGQHSQEVVVNEALARKFWPGMNPIGQRLLTIDDQLRPRRVIGVVGNIKHFGLDTDGKPEMYLPYAWWSSMAMVARTNSDPAGTISALTSEVRALDKNVAVYQIAKMEELLGRSVTRQRMDLFLLAAFASLALILAAGGLYGVLALMVSSRRHEIGVRMALGARPTEIMRLVVGRGTRLALIGLVIGTALSLALTRVMTGLLFKVSATDPMVFLTVIVLLLVVSALASWLPAQRAMRVDPMDALRSE